MPIVSVIIAAYNCRQTIGRAIESAQRQSLTDIEIVVADDASSDDTAAFVQSLAAADARLKLVRLPQNGGVSAARNAAIEAARGQWIAVLDADDWYEPSRLEILLKGATDLQADAICDNLRIYDHAREQVVDETRHGGHSTIILMPEFLFMHDTPLRLHAIGYLKPMVRAEFLRRHGIAYNLEFRAGEDFLFLMEILLKGGRGFLIPGAYYVYRHRISPTTRKISPHSRSEAGFELAVRGCDYIRQKYGASMSRAALKALAHKRGVFVSRIHCGEMIGALRQRKPLEAACILARCPFIIVLLTATAAKWIYANIFIYRPGAK
jgi:succinoglycan biosynthesis protein ExoO